MTDASIDAVVWDIGRVLVQWDLRGIYADAIPDAEQRDWFVQNIVTESWHFLHDEGEAMADMVAQRSAEYPQYRALIERYATHWLDSVPGPVPGTSALIEALAVKGVPQFSITNFGADAWVMFRPTFPVLDHVRDIVVSGVEKMVKPNPAIFALAADRFGHAPDRMLFIDDNAANIAAAAKAGWNVHHFVDGADALEADFRTRGLL